MNWYQIPSTIRCFILGFLICAFLSSQGHAEIGIPFFFGLFILGIVVDVVMWGWRTFWAFTQTCGFCGIRVSPMTRARVLSDDLKHGKYWFCSPKCYMEFSRRFHATERKQITVLNDGEPFIKFPTE